jgi:hypothetical protein
MDIGRFDGVQHNGFDVRQLEVLKSTPVLEPHNVFVPEIVLGAWPNPSFLSAPNRQPSAIRSFAQCSCALRASNSLSFSSSVPIRAFCNSIGEGL